MLTPKDLQQISQHLLHRLERFPAKNKLPKVPLLAGVICEVCRLQMLHERKCFKCTRCGKKKLNGAREALHAYRYLKKEWITNREFRDYTRIKSIHTTNKVLKRLCTESSGGNKDRKYKIPADVLEKGLFVK